MRFPFQLFLILAAFFQVKPAAAMTIEDVESYIRKNKITSVETFVANLSAEMRTNYVLMYQSRSLQEASFQNPRVIMFSNNAQYILSFNGSKSQRNGNKIEMILFDESTAKFNAHEIDFDGGKATVHKNPPICMSCHGTDLRPNWNAYNFWPGAYGSNDGRLFYRVKQGGERDYEEYDQLKKFEASAPHHQRYKHLLKLEEHSTLSGGSLPGQDPRDFVRTVTEPNSTFNERVFKLNFQRMTRIFQSHPQYEQFKYSMLAAFSCDKHHLLKSLPKDYKLNLRFDISLKYNESEHGFHDSYVRNVYQSALFESLGIDERFLDTNFNFQYPENLYREAYVDDLITKYGGPGVPKYEFAYAFARKDPQLKKFLFEIDHPDEEAQVKCDELSARGSQETFKASQTTSLKRDNLATNGRMIFQSVCLKCHQDASVAGYSFDEAALRKHMEREPRLIDRFRYRLDEETPTGERMPFGEELTKSERDAVKRYVESISSGTDSN